MIEVLEGGDGEGRKTIGEGIFLHGLDMPDIVEIEAPCHQNANND